MTRRISFNDFDDKNDAPWFEYCERAPDNFFPLGKREGRINISALILYAIYRTVVFDSYELKPNLADDIRSHKNEYHEMTGSRLAANPVYTNPVHHHSVAASLGAMKEWLDPKENMQCYFAYQNVNGHKRIVGFIHFQEKIMGSDAVVYIAQAGVINRSTGVGRRLMECVLSHYPGGMHFKILTRVFNTEAKSLYQDRLLFSPMREEEVSHLGYDNRYCGFEHTTSDDEVAAIKKKQIKHANDDSPNVGSPALFERVNQAVGQHDADCEHKPGFH